MPFASSNESCGWVSSQRADLPFVFLYRIDNEDEFRWVDTPSGSRFRDTRVRRKRMRDESERERKRKAEGMPIEEKSGKRARIRTRHEKEQRGEDVENLNIEGQAKRRKTAVTNKEGTSTQTTESQLRRRLRKGSQILSQRIPGCNQERGRNVRGHANDVQKEMNDVIIIEDDVPTSCTASEESQPRSGGSWASSGDYTPTQPFELNRSSSQRKMGSSRLNCSPSQQPICDRKKRKKTDSPLQEQTPTTKKRTSPINSSCSQASSLSQSTLPYYFVDQGNPSHHSSSSSQHQSKPRLTSSQSQKEATASQHRKQQQQNKPSTQDRTKRRKDQPHPLNDENVENQRNTCTGPLNHPSAQLPSSNQGKSNQWLHTRSVKKENYDNMAGMQLAALPPPTSPLPASCNRKSRAPVTLPPLDPLPTSTLKPAECSLSYDRLYYSVLSSLPSLAVQHRFHALTSVKEQLMPLYNKYIIDDSQFEQIANSVCDQYILMLGDQIERKSPQLTPKRLQTLRTLLQRELQKHTQINAT